MRINGHAGAGGSVVKGEGVRGTNVKILEKTAAALDLLSPSETRVGLLESCMPDHELLCICPRHCYTCMAIQYNFVVHSQIICVLSCLELALSESARQCVPFILWERDPQCFTLCLSDFFGPTQPATHGHNKSLYLPSQPN